MGDMASIAAANDEAIRAWNGVLFDRFLQYREIVTTGLGAHGEIALAAHPPAPGARVLDIGCGFGDTSRRLAELVGPEGSVLGVDAAERFVELARQEAAEAGVGNVEFRVADVQAHRFEERFDLAFSRFGTMFFANPVARCATCARRSCPAAGSAWSCGDASSTTSGCTAPSRSSSSSSATRRSRPTSRPAAPARSRWPTAAGPDGVRATASTWIVSARSPSGA